jgi:hypothetical protein
MYWYLLKTILSALLSSSLFKETRLGLWIQTSLDRVMTYVTDKYDLDIAKKEEKWFKRYPGLKARIESLEDKAHYKCGIEEFDGYADIDNRITKLEDTK